MANLYWVFGDNSPYYFTICVSKNAVLNGADFGASVRYLGLFIRAEFACYCSLHFKDIVRLALLFCAQSFMASFRWCIILCLFIDNAGR